MKKLKLFTALAFACIFSFSSCSKDEENTGVAEGKMAATIDGKSVDMTVNAIMHKESLVSGGSFEWVVITGLSGTSQADMKSFAIYVYDTKISTKSYPVPTYTDTYVYDPLKGYSMGVYMTGTDYTNYYASMNYKNATGSVTIESVSSTNVKGSYDMTLINSLDMTKTMKLKGSFNAKVISYTTGK